MSLYAKNVCVVLCAGLLAACAGTAGRPRLRAATWVVTSGNWSTRGNWSTGTAPSGPGQTAVLNNAVAPVSVTLDVPVTLGRLVLGNADGTTTSGFSIITDPNTLTLNNSGSASQITVPQGTHAISAAITLAGNLNVSPSAGSTLTLNGNINESVGGSSVTLSDWGTLVLNGLIGYTGGTFVNAGTLGGRSKLTSVTVNPGGLFGPGNSGGGPSVVCQVASMSMPYSSSQQPAQGSVDIGSNTLVVGSPNKLPGNSSTPGTVIYEANQLDVALQSFQNNGDFSNGGLGSSAVDNSSTAVGNIILSEAEDFLGYTYTQLNNGDGSTLTLASGANIDPATGAENGVRGYEIFKPALLGDLNLDGVVDQTDLTIAEDHLGWKFDNSGPGHYVADEWAFGDVLHEGSVTLDDLSAIAGDLARRGA